MFKKIALFAFLIMGLAGVSQAYDFGISQERNVYVKYTQTLTATLTSTAAIIVDLSDTTNWPHKEKGEIRVSWLRVSFDKAAASTETLKLGVVNFVNASTGTVTWFYSLPSSYNASNTNVVDVINYSPSWINLRVIPDNEDDAGVTPYLLSNDKTNGSTVYQNDVKLPTTSGTAAAPGYGDIILYIDNSDTAGANDWTITVELIYQALKR